MAKVGVESKSKPSGSEATSWSFDLLPGFAYAGANYVKRPPDCWTEFMDCITLGCYPKIEYRASGNKAFDYQNNCTFLCCSLCPWTVRENGELTGTIKKAGCCDNGMCYFCCSCCVCKDIMTIKFYDKDNVLVNNMRIYDGCLNKCCSCSAGVWGTICASCLDSCAWCGNTNMVVISEKIFEADMENKEHVGEIHQVMGLTPIYGTGCCVQRVPIRVSVKSNAGLKDKKMVGVFSLLPIMQSGQIKKSMIAPATGSMCDCGRYVTFKRMTFEQMLNETEATTGGAPTGELTDKEAVLELSPMSRLLKTDEEIAALPTRPYLWGGEIVIDKANVIHRE